MKDFENKIQEIGVIPCCCLHARIIERCLSVRDQNLKPEICMNDKSMKGPIFNKDTKRMINNDIITKLETESKLTSVDSRRVRIANRWDGVLKDSKLLLLSYLLTYLLTYLFTYLLIYLLT